jgi:copper chaperone CopZ
MKMKPWMPLVMIAVMTLGMITLMVMISLMFGAPNMVSLMLPMVGNAPSGMWQLMVLPALGLLVMGGLMFFMFRWMAKRMGMMPGSGSKTETITQEGESKHTTTLTFTIPNVSCDGCKTRIESELGSMSGVASVFVDVEKQKAEVNLIKPPGRSEIETLLKDIGYPAQAG